MDQKFELQILVWTEIDRIILENFTTSEKKELEKTMKLFKINTWFIVVYFFKNENYFIDKFLEFDIADLNNDPILKKLTEDFMGTSKNKILELKKLQKDFRKIATFALTNKAISNKKEFQTFIQLYHQNMFFLDERLNGIEVEIISKEQNKPFTKFKFAKPYSKSCYDFYKVLKKNKKIDLITLEDHFEMIFSLRKVNAKFKKINWISSIYQLKNLIDLMIKKNILEKDVDYLNTIANCFLIKNEELTVKKLDPRGERHTIDYQDDLLKNIFKVS